jgi:hypothetical protein
MADNLPSAEERVGEAHSATAAAPAEEAPEEAGGQIAWSVWPATLYLWRALAGVGVISLTVVFLTYYAGGPLLGVLGGVLLLLVLNGFFLPTSYRMDARGVQQKRLFFRLERSWGDFRCFYTDRFGMMLSTKQRPSRLDPWRGFSLWFPDDKRAAERNEPTRAQIIDYVEQHVPPYRKPRDHRDLLG